MQRFPLIIYTHFGGGFNFEMLAKTPMWAVELKVNGYACKVKT